MASKEVLTHLKLAYYVDGRDDKQIVDSVNVVLDTASSIHAGPRIVRSWVNALASSLAPGQYDHARLERLENALRANLRIRLLQAAHELDRPSSIPPVVPAMKTISLPLTVVNPYYYAPIMPQAQGFDAMTKSTIGNTGSHFVQDMPTFSPPHNFNPVMKPFNPIAPQFNPGMSHSSSSPHSSYIQTPRKLCAISIRRPSDVQSNIEKHIATEKDNKLETTQANSDTKTVAQSQLLTSFARAPPPEVSRWSPSTIESSSEDIQRNEAISSANTKGADTTEDTPIAKDKSGHHVSPPQNELTENISSTAFQKESALNAKSAQFHTTTNRPVWRLDTPAKVSDEPPSKRITTLARPAASSTPVATFDKKIKFKVDDTWSKDFLESLQARSVASRLEGRYGGPSSIPVSDKTSKVPSQFVGSSDLKTILSSHPNAAALDALPERHFDPFVDTPQATESVDPSTLALTDAEPAFDLGRRMRWRSPPQWPKSSYEDWWAPESEPISKRPEAITEKHTPLQAPIAQRSPRKLAYLQSDWTPGSRLQERLDHSHEEEKKRYPQEDIVKPAARKQAGLSTDFDAIPASVGRALARGPRYYADEYEHEDPSLSPDYAVRDPYPSNWYSGDKRIDRHNSKFFPFVGGISVWHITETQPWPEQTVYAAMADLTLRGSSFVLYKPAMANPSRPGEFFFVMDLDAYDIWPTQFELNLVQHRATPSGQRSPAHVRRMNFKAGCLTCGEVHATRPCNKWLTVLEEDSVVDESDTGSLRKGDLDSALTRISSLPEGSPRRGRMMVMGRKIGVTAAKNAFRRRTRSVTEGKSLRAVGATPQRDNDATSAAAAMFTTAAKLVRSGSATIEREGTPLLWKKQVDLSSPDTTRTVIPIASRNSISGLQPTQDVAMAKEELESLRNSTTNDGDDEASPSDNVSPRDEASLSDLFPSHSQHGEDEEVLQHGGELSTTGPTQAGTSIARAFRLRHEEELRQIDAAFETGTAVGFHPEGPDINGWLAATVTPPGLDVTKADLPRIPSDLAKVLAAGRGADYSTSEGGWSPKEGSLLD